MKYQDIERDNRNQHIIDEYKVTRQNRIKNEPTAIGWAALVFSVLTIGQLFFAVVVIYLAATGIKRGQKFEYETGVESKQKLLSVISLAVMVFGIAFSYFISFVNVQNML